MKRIFWLLTVIVLGWNTALAQGGNFERTTEKEKTPQTNNKKSVSTLDLLDDIDLDEDPTSLFEDLDSVKREGETARFRQPMKFTRREMNKITDPRIRDMYWYALNDSTDKKRYLKAHYAFNKMADNWSVEVRGGVNYVFSKDFKTTFALGPQVEVGFKKDIHPYWAARVDFGWSHYRHYVFTSHMSTMITDRSWLRPDAPGNSEYTGGDWWQEIEYTSLAARLKVMLNMVNCFSGREVLYVPYTWYVYGGAGAIYSAKNLGERDHSCLIPLWVVGTQLGWNFTERHTLTFDLNGSWQGDDLEGYNTSNSTWKTTAMVGLSYKFSKVIHFQRLGYDQDFQRQQIQDALDDGDMLQTVIESQKESDVVELPSEMIQAAFFQIDRVELQHTYVLNLGFYAELIKTHPQQKFLVKGFADIEVGSMKRNLWLSEQRAKVVADVLIRTYGVDPDQLLIGGGDLNIDIPFLREQGHHKFNRCTIVCPLGSDYKVIKLKDFKDKNELNSRAPINKNY